MEGFSASSPPRIFWNSRKRSATPRSLENKLKEETLKPAGDGVKAAVGGQCDDELATISTAKAAALTERRRSLFEPLEPTSSHGNRTLAELLLPPPDFEATSYPKGWLVGKKRKLVNIDVVESMRRIAVQEMNRKAIQWHRTRRSMDSTSSWRRTPGAWSTSRSNFSMRGAKGATPRGRTPCSKTRYPC